MTRPLIVTLALGALLWGSEARGEAPPAELRRLFPHEADVAAPGGGLRRLVVPPEILAACRPDLSDLRLFDAQDREVPFLVDAAMPSEISARISRQVRLETLEAARNEIAREHGPSQRRESFELRMPGDAPKEGNWVLLVEPRAGEFVARVSVEGLGEDGAATTLLKDASLFHIRGAREARKNRIPLPEFAGKRLRVTLETEHPFWLEPRFTLESARSIERSGWITVPLEVVSIRAGDRRTLVDLARPAGIVPERLRIETATGTFDRGVDVFDDGPVGGDAPLGTGRVFRVGAAAPIGEQEVALSPARADRLRVEIEDGDSPPLETPAFAAIIRQPSLIFSLATGSAGDTRGILRFGGGRAHSPRYDLAALLPGPTGSATGARAEAAAVLYDRAAIQPASVGAMRPNPAFDGAPALAFAMRAGAGIDRRLFSHRRTLDVPAAAEGLSRLRIDPADLSLLNPDLSDLRVADEAARQWPYLLDREARTEILSLRVEGPLTRGGTSRYDLVPAVSPARLDELLLETDAAFFDRAYRLEARGSGEEDRLVARGRILRASGETGPVKVALDSLRVESFTLVIEDGDDAPLVFRRAQARLRLPDLFLTAPQGHYTLLMGGQDHDPPRYELERVRDVILAVKAAPISAGPLGENEEYSLGARLAGRGPRQTALLWGSLIAAVAVLAIMTLRLARRVAPPAA